MNSINTRIAENVINVIIDNKLKLLKISFTTTRTYTH